MATPTYTYVQVQIMEDSHVALVKYNRPQSGNSLLPKMLSEMVSAMKWVHNQSDVRIIIQTGAGRFFNTGMELVNSDGMSFAKGSDFHELNRILISSEKILIAAVNGPAAGRLFLHAVCQMGMAAEGASSFSFPRLMGHQRAASLFLAGERITAQEAQTVGLISKILPKDNFLQRVAEIAKRMSQSPPGSLRATKKLMKAPVIQDFLDANDRECGLIHAERYGFEEYQEAVKQFKVEQDQKRKLTSKM